MFTAWISDLAHARAELTALDAEWKVLLEAFEEQHAVLKDARAAAKAMVNEYEDRLREQVTDYYAETGDKKPHPALGIRVSTAYEYDADAALTWAMSHKMTNTLKLDTRAFTGIIKAGAVPADELNVQTVEKVTATIATDLSEYTEESED